MARTAYAKKASGGAHADADGAQADAGALLRRAAGFEIHLRPAATLEQVWRTVDVGFLLQIVSWVPRRVHDTTCARADAAPGVRCSS